MTGGTGFVRTYLTKRLISEKHKVTILTQPPGGAALKISGAVYLAGNPTIKGEWQEAVKEYDVIINLAGASIFSRFTPEQKKILRESRIETTRNLVAALPENAQNITFFSTSAVGFYRFHEDEELTEDMASGHDFLAMLAADWEQEAMHAQKKDQELSVKPQRLSEVVPVQRQAQPLFTGTSMRSRTFLSQASISSSVASLMLPAG